MFTIYCLTNTKTGYRYVGSTSNYESRRYNHLNRMKHGTHSNKRMQSDYNVTGAEAWEFLELTTTPHESQRYELEQTYMDEIKPEYNVLPFAGSAKGRVFSEETLRKMSMKASKRVVSEEHKQKLRTLRKGTVTSEETKRKQSEAHLKRYANGGDNGSKKISNNQATTIIRLVAEGFDRRFVSEYYGIPYPSVVSISNGTTRKRLYDEYHRNL